MPNILFDLTDGVATLTLNRPDAANALDVPTLEELLPHAIRCDADDVRAVILTGSGDGFFCAGGDLKSFADDPNVDALLKRGTTYFHGAIAKLMRMRAPLIVAINGQAAGGGMSFSLIGDIVLCADHAKFTMGYTAAGLAMDGSSSYFLPRVVGMRRAMELTLTNRQVGPEEAAELGLVTRVVPKDDLMTEAQKLATQFASGPTGAFGWVKRLLCDSFSNTLETQMELETRAIAATAGSADGREGVGAFVNKRKPTFTGAQTDW
jgi:2-(1,2-epoxy-1,2-dihydrophenyl)acetyl-CoA isomerase